MRIEEYDNGVHREQVVNLWKTVFGYQDRRNDPEIALDKKLQHKDGLLFVAVNEDRLIGTVMAGYDGHRGWIYSLAVMPEMRELGIGTRLLAKAEEKLRELGCMKINLQILPTNNAVLEFYEKNGYRVEDRISMGKEIRENIPG